MSAPAIFNFLTNKKGGLVWYRSHCVRAINKLLLNFFRSNVESLDVEVIATNERLENLE